MFNELKFHGNSKISYVDGGFALQSYETIMISYDISEKKFHLHSCYFTMTTKRHINKFAKFVGSDLTWRELEEYDIESVPSKFKD